MSDLKHILAKGESIHPPNKQADVPPTARSGVSEGDNPTPPPENVTAANVAAHVEAIEVEAIVGGVLQKVRFGPGTNPAQVGDILRSLDPGVQTRDAFPRKGGARETKPARVLVVNYRATDSGAFIDLVCQSGDDDLSISVPKKAAAEFPGQMRALSKVNERNLSKLEKAASDKGTATLILTESEQFGAKYWSTDDNRHFLDSLEAEPPVIEEQNHG